MSFPLSKPRLASVVAVLALLASCRTTAPVSEAPSPAGARATSRPAREALIVSINDTYRVEGVYDGAAGGFARVRTLRKELEAEHPDLLLLHAGDLFFPSLLSRMYQGEQMVDGLNLLDGKANTFDPRLFVTFGNHEFDRGKLADAAIVQARVSESHFTWLAGNVTFEPGADGKPLVAGSNLVPRAVVESGGLRIGVFGLTIDNTIPAYAKISDPFEAARRSTAELRAAGAEVIVGLTHLDLDQDVEILRRLGAEGPDLILGGHEHTIQLEQVGERWVCKADADAASACVARVSVDGAGKVRVAEPEHRPLGGVEPAPDPAVECLARHWLDLHQQKFCAQAKRPPGCLNEKVGRATTELQAEETQIRGYETNLGNWLADRMLAAFADRGAQVAFVNSGSLRLNRDIAAGADIRARDLEELFGFSMKLRLVKIKGADLAAIARHAVEQWPGKGWWLQIAGLAFRYDNDDAPPFDLTLLAPGGPRPVRPDEEILAVTTEFLTNPAIGNQDGYTMLKPEQVVAEGGELIDLMRAALQQAGEAGIAPQREGRICNPADSLPCLAVEK